MVANNYYKLAVISRDDDGFKFDSYVWPFNDQDQKSEIMARAATLAKHTELLSKSKFPQLSAWRPTRHLPADEIGKFEENGY